MTIFLRHLKGISTFTAVAALSFFCSIDTYAQNRGSNVEPPIKLKPEREKQIRDLALEKILKQIKPIDSDEFDQFKEISEYNQENLNSTYLAPDLLNRTVAVNPVPGQRPPTIFTAKNYTTSLTFLDKSGNPWPIEKHTMVEDLYVDNSVDSNILQFIPNSNQPTNLTVKLKDSKYLISFLLTYSKERVDDKATIVVDQFGPEYFDKKNSPVDYITNINSSVRFESSDFLALLDGRSPENSERMRVVSKGGLPIDDEIEAWKKENTLYIRMKYGSVLSPDPGFIKTNPSGEKIFAVTADSAPEIMINFNGRVMPIKIESYN